MRVFISYASSEKTADAVSQLAHELRTNNIAVVLDTDCPRLLGPLEGWKQWMRKTIEEVDWVLIVFDEIYSDVFNGKIPEDRKKGAAFEGRQISHDLNMAYGRNGKYVPLLLDGAPEYLIPAEFDCTHYRIPTQNAQLAALLAAARARPSSRPPLKRGRLYANDRAVLIGRTQLLAELSSALENPAVGVFGVIADGGVGKSALVDHWITTLDHATYGDRPAYCWPFFDTAKNQVTTAIEFFCTALKELDTTQRSSDNLPSDEAHNLATILQRNGPILVLDGLEALQHPTDGDNACRGDLIDERLYFLLTEVASKRADQKRRLVVVTSRLPLPQLAACPGYRQQPLGVLEPPEGAKLLMEQGVRGTPDELEQASQEYDGHCLCLVLLGRIIATHYPDHHVSNRRWVDIPGAPADYLQGIQRHAQRVMDFYEQEISREEDVVFLKMMSLFLEAMNDRQRDVLIEKANFAKRLQGCNWTALEARLEEIGLLVPELPALRRTRWDCHPLIRQHFRDKLRAENELWRDAHKVLFEFFQEVPAQRQPDTREGLQPLYRAVRHGCLAQLFKDALDVYRDRILRHDAQGFSTNRVGAAADDVALLRGFMTDRGEVRAEASSQLGPDGVAWLWGRLAFCQTCRGALDDAIRNREQQLRFAENRQDWMSAASAAENLSGLLLLSGNLVRAHEVGRTAETYANDADDWGEKVHALCRLAAVNHSRGEFSLAREHFQLAAELKRNQGGPEPWITVVHGFRYRSWCLDCASNKDDYKMILKEAEGAMRPDESWLVPFGLDILIKAVALWRLGEQPAAEIVFNEALRTLKNSGHVVYVAYCYNAKAEFDIAAARYDSALANLLEARRTAVYYGMPLLEADSWLIEAEMRIAMADCRKAIDARDKAEEIVVSCGYQLRSLELRILEGTIDLLSGRQQEGEAILDETREGIERTGRKSLFLKLQRGQQIRRPGGGQRATIT